MDPVVHFEMPYHDRARAADFYAEAFGWQAQMLGEDMGRYVIMTTAVTDAKPGAPAGAINGGLFPSRTDWPAQYPSVVIGVKELRAAMARVARAGGQLLGEPMEIPGVGHYVAFMDSEGNRVSMLQPLPLTRAAGDAPPRSDAAASRTPSELPGAVRSALLVIDVQQGICEGEHVSFESQRVIERINQLSAQARAAAAPVIFIQHETPDGAFAHGSRTWQLATGLRADAGDIFLRKTTADAFHRTELEQVLRQHAIAELVVCGLHSEFCVDTTTRRAAALGYPVTLVADAHSTEDKQHLSAAQITRHHNATLSDITSFGVRIRAVVAQDVRFQA